MNLADIPTRALLDELSRRVRAEDRRHRKNPILNCDTCTHFRPWPNLNTLPAGYNPCSRGHAMQFTHQSGYSDPNWGFYKPRCPDRA